MEGQNQPLIVINYSQWQEISQGLKKISEALSNYTGKNIQEVEEEYITAEMFMAKAHISRSTFDELRFKNEIKVIQKGRKLYTPKSEIQRYFNS